MKDFDNLRFYQIYPISFYDSNNDGLGDIKGIIKKLDYIKFLGFNAIWLNPIYLSPFKDGGYDVIDFYKIDPRFGSQKDLEKLIKKTHELGMKIILDLVAGHLSDESKEFKMSCRDKPNKFSDLFIWTNDVFVSNSQVKLVSGRYERNGSFAINFFDFQPSLNYGFYKVDDPKWQISYLDQKISITKDFLLNIMRFYLNKGIDGFRVDMANSLVKNDSDFTGTIYIWNDLFKIIKKEFPNAYFVSEWSDINKASDAGFDSDFDLFSVEIFKIMFNAKEDKENQFLKYFNELNERLLIAQKNDSRISFISGNHDQNRLLSKLTLKQAKSYLTLIYGLPGNPFIYYGDELGLKTIKVKTKDGGYFRTGSRTPMQWDDTKNFGFSKSDEIYLPTQKNIEPVSQQIKNNNSLLNYIKKLNHIRESYVQLIDSKFKYENKNGLYIFERKNLQILFNCTKNNFPIKNCIVSSGKNLNMLKPFECCIIDKGKFYDF